MSDQATTHKPNPDTPIAHTFFTFEIRGGDPMIAKRCAQMVEMEMETLVLMLQGIYGHRKGTPAFEVHKPGTVEA